MRQLDLNELPQWSQWPSRLLGLAPWTIPTRTIEKAQQEYDEDKYFRCLRHWMEVDGRITAEDVRQFEFGYSPDDTICVSLQNDLYEMTVGEARRLHDQSIAQSILLEMSNCNTVVELGAGYGYNLWRLKLDLPMVDFIGGEYSRNAVDLASRLYKDDSNLKVVPFNFYEPETYDFLDLVNPPLMVFTVHAIEQLPCASAVFDCLMKFRKKIKVVVHFEPLYEMYDKTLIGLMRSRYTEINDYNRDLLSELRQRRNIHIVKVDKNVVGLNPLNPTSILQWKFAA